MKMNSISACHSQRPEQYRGFLRKLAIIQKRINIRKRSRFSVRNYVFSDFDQLVKNLLQKVIKICNCNFSNKSFGSL